MDSSSVPLHADTDVQRVLPATSPSPQIAAPSEYTSAEAQLPPINEQTTIKAEHGVPQSLNSALPPQNHDSRVRTSDSLIKESETRSEAVNESESVTKTKLEQTQTTTPEVEYRFLAWKKNAQHLYDTLYAFELPWPSSTVQWIPELITKQGRPSSRSGNQGSRNQGLGTTRQKQRLVLATSTGGQAPEYLRIAELDAPVVDAPASLGEYDGDSGTIGGYHPAYAADLAIVQRITAQGSINRARAMPQNPNVVASVATTGEAAIWDTTKFPYNPVPHYVPTVSLVGHAAEALCVSWSAVAEGQLATGDAEGRVFVWDLRRVYDSTKGSMEPVLRRGHAQGAAVNDLQWHPRRPATLASVGDDGFLIVHETAAESSRQITEVKFKEKRPTCVAWNPVNESLIAVGFDTGAVELWDLRSAPTRLGAIEAHTGYVTALHWNTWHASVYATASEDGTVKVWNAVDFSSKPLFTHGGHNAAVTDVAWNPATPGMLASVAEDNGMHVFVPDAEILGF